MTKAIAGVIAIVVVACIGVPMLLLSAVLGGSGGCTPAVPVASGQPGIGRWDAEQVAIAATIVEVGSTKGVPRWGWMVALATAMQESELRNLSHLDGRYDQDSIGVFQQRPSQGWGTPQQLADPAYQAGKFYDTLLTVPGWEQLPLARAAQAVQRSAHPDAYTRWTTDAILLADAVGSGRSWATSVDLEQCPSTCPAILSKTGSIAPSLVPSGDVRMCEWVAPVRAPIVSGFRTPARPGHDGVDLGAARGTPIRAASAGTVLVARCNVVRASHGCDRDGSPRHRAAAGMWIFSTPVRSSHGIATCSPGPQWSKANR